MSLFRSNVWLLLVMAAVISALLVLEQSSDNAAKLGAFFTVLGDAVVLLSLCQEEENSQVSS